MRIIKIIWLSTSAKYVVFWRLKKALAFFELRSKGEDVIGMDISKCCNAEMVKTMEIGRFMEMRCVHCGDVVYTSDTRRTQRVLLHGRNIVPSCTTSLGLVVSWCKKLCR